MAWCYRLLPAEWETRAVTSGNVAGTYRARDLMQRIPWDRYQTFEEALEQIFKLPDARVA